MKKLLFIPLITIGLIVFLLFPNGVSATTETFNSSTTWEAPANVFSVDVEAWGAGGSGGMGAANGSGGGGGAYSKKLSIPVTPGNSYTVTVGTGGAAISTTNTAGNSGGDSWFKSTGDVLAKGGGGGNFAAATDPISGGTGGDSGAGVGDTKYSGGNAGNIGTNGGNGTGGGGGAGDTGAGGNSSDADSNQETVGGTGGTTNGGNGGDGDRSSGTSATAGSTLGGGGGGRSRVLTNNGSSGAGADGQIKLTYTATLPSIPSLSVFSDF